MLDYKNFAVGLVCYISKYSYFRIKSMQEPETGTTTLSTCQIFLQELKIKRTGYVSIVWKKGKKSSYSLKRQLTNNKCVFNESLLMNLRLEFKGQNNSLAVRKTTIFLLDADGYQIDHSIINLPDWGTEYKNMQVFLGDGLLKLKYKRNLLTSIKQEVLEDDSEHSEKYLDISQVGDEKIRHTEQIKRIMKRLQDAQYLNNKLRNDRASLNHQVNQMRHKMQTLAKHYQSKIYIRQKVYQEEIANLVSQINGLQYGIQMMAQEIKKRQIEFTSSLVFYKQAIVKKQQQEQKSIIDDNQVCVESSVQQITQQRVDTSMQFLRLNKGTSISSINKSRRDLMKSKQIQYKIPQIISLKVNDSWQSLKQIQSRQFNKDLLQKKQKSKNQSSPQEIEQDQMLKKQLQEKQKKYERLLVMHKQLEARLRQMEKQRDQAQQNDKVKLRKKNKEFLKIKQQLTSEKQHFQTENLKLIDKVAQTQIQIQLLKSNNNKLTAKVKQLSRSEVLTNSSFSEQFLKTENQKLQQQLQSSKNTLLKYKYEADAQIHSITLKLTQSLKRQKQLKKQIEQVSNIKQCNKQLELKKLEQLIKKKRLLQAQVQKVKEQKTQSLREAKRDYQKKINQLKIELTALKANGTGQIEIKSVKDKLQKSEINYHQQKQTKQQTLRSLNKLNKQIKWQQQQISQLIQYNQKLQQMLKQKTNRLEQFQAIILDVESDLSQMRIKARSVEQQNLRLLEQFQNITYYNQADIRTLVSQFKSKYEQRLRDKQAKLRSIQIQNGQIFQHHKNTLMEKQKVIVQHRQHIQNLQQKIKILEESNQQQKLIAQMKQIQRLRQLQEKQNQRLKAKLQKILDVDTELQDYCKQIKQDLDETTIANLNLQENQECLRNQIRRLQQIIIKRQQQLEKALEKLNMVQQKSVSYENQNNQLKILIGNQEEKYEFLKEKLRQVKQQYDQQTLQCQQQNLELREQISRVRQQNQLLKQLIEYQKDRVKNQYNKIYNSKKPNKPIEYLPEFKQVRNPFERNQTDQLQLLRAKYNQLQTECAKVKNQRDSLASREFQLYSFMQTSRKLCFSQSAEQLNPRYNLPEDSKRKYKQIIEGQNNYLKGLIAQLNDLKTNNMQKQKTIHQLTNQRNTIEQKLNNKIEQNQFVSQSLRNLKSQLQNQKSQKQTAKNRIKQLTKLIKSLNTKINQLQNLQKVYSKTISNQLSNNQILKRHIKLDQKAQTSNLCRDRQAKNMSQKYSMVNEKLSAINLALYNPKLKKNVKDKSLSPPTKQHYVPNIQIPSKDKKLSSNNSVKSRQFTPYSPTNKSISNYSSIKNHIY